VSWQSSAKADQVLETLVETDKIGNTSLKLKFTIRQFESKQVVAEAEMVYVMVGSESYQKISVPEEVAAKLLAGSPGVVTNHAGINI
jgi:acyl-CoA thioester hydrolase